MVCSVGKGDQFSRETNVVCRKQSQATVIWVGTFTGYSYTAQKLACIINGCIWPHF
jgi:hypothetical protein